jgi:hypothetical protein
MYSSDSWPSGRQRNDAPSSHSSGHRQQACDPEQAQHGPIPLAQSGCPMTAGLESLCIAIRSFSTARKTVTTFGYRRGKQ